MRKYKQNGLDANEQYQQYKWRLAANAICFKTRVRKKFLNNLRYFTQNKFLHKTEWLTIVSLLSLALPGHFPRILSWHFLWTAQWHTVTCQNMNQWFLKDSFQSVMLPFTAFQFVFRNLQTVCFYRELIYTSVVYIKFHVTLELSPMFIPLPCCVGEMNEYATQKTGSGKHRQAIKYSTLAWMWHCQSLKDL